MRFLHLADLHFGKSIYGMSLHDEQEYWLNALLKLVNELGNLDAVVVAGDVYDRAIPTREALPLLDKFLTAFSERKIPVLMIAGNHDSGTRLGFGNRLLHKSGVYIVGHLTKKLESVVLEDEYGKVNFWMLPYFFPAAVREILGEEQIEDYESAAEAILNAQEIDFTQRNILIAHQLVVAGESLPERGGSETTVGGVGQINSAVFEGFDYTALGHIHKAQAMGKSKIRYAGSPLCYHFDEVGQTKGVLVVELGEKGIEPQYTLYPLPVLHPLCRVEGTLKEIIKAETEQPHTGRCMQALLTDTQLPANAVDQLRQMFAANGNVLLETRRKIERSFSDETAPMQENQTLDLEELFRLFYQAQNAGEMPDEQEQSVIDFVAEQVARQPELSREERQEYAEKIADFVLRDCGKGEEV